MFVFGLGFFFLAALGLCRCVQVSLVWFLMVFYFGERGLLFVAVHGLLIAVASLCCRARALGVQASVVAARGLSSCGSWALERRLYSRGARA